MSREHGQSARPERTRALGTGKAGRAQSVRYSNTQFRVDGVSPNPLDSGLQQQSSKGRGPPMIIKTLALKINSTRSLLVAFDVGKSALDLYFEVPNTADSTFEATSGNIPKKPRNILATLDALAQRALVNGYSGLFITCESTGAYSEKLF